MKKQKNFSNKMVRMLALGIGQYKDPYYQGVAAQLAFYFMLSIVPTILVLSQFLGLLDISLDVIDSLISKYMKSDVGQTLQHLMIYNKSRIGTNVTLIVMAVWAASRVQFSLTRITDYTYSAGSLIGNYWKERLRAMGILILTIISMAGLIVAFIYAELMLKSVLGLVANRSIYEAIIKLLRWPIAGLCYFLVVSFNYYVLPTNRRTFKEILPGSVFSAVGMLIVTIGYSKYTAHAVNYDIIYGSLASIVLLMLWFYFISWVLCIGIVLNKICMDMKKITF